MCSQCRSPCVPLGIDHLQHTIRAEKILVSVKMLLRHDLRRVTHLDEEAAADATLRAEPPDVLSLSKLMHSCEGV